MHRIRLFLILLLATAVFGAANAQGDLQCVKEKCEGKGRTCVEALYDRVEACTKAARKKCDTVPVAEKFNCLRAGLSPCARTRNQEQAACLDGFRSCHQTCGPFKDKRTHYWCVASIGNETTAAFCNPDPAAKVTDQCARVFSRSTPHGVSMTCDSLP